MELADGVLLKLFMSSVGLWWVIFPGMLLGIIVGILPGFSAQNTLIILLPLTLHMSIEAGMAFMISLYCTTQLGGGIPAILFNMPGEGGAAATTLDGYPMTKRGEAQQALVLCFAASAFGGLVTTIAAMVLLPALGRLGDRAFRRPPVVTDLEPTVLEIPLAAPGRQAYGPGMRLR